MGQTGLCWGGGCVLGVIREWGAAPLPSPPVGGRAGSGARAPRTGSSCGPWGPWRAAARSWGVWLSLAPLSGAAGGACCAEKEEEHCPYTQGNPALHEGNTRGQGGLGSGARLQHPAQRPQARAQGPRAFAARYRFGARGSGSRPELSPGLSRLPSASLHQLLSIPRSAFFLSAPLLLLTAPHGSQPRDPSLSSLPGTSAQAFGGRA